MSDAKISRLARQASLWLILVAGAGVLFFYLNRVFAELPLYAGDEGAYLIRALYAHRLDIDPGLYPGLQTVENPVYFALVRLVDLLSLNLLPWMRLLGMAAYAGGLAALYAIAVREGGRSAANAVLLVAAAFPYYRFVVTAMPEGLYIGGLCAIALIVHRAWLTRPVHAAFAAGALSAVLVLIKPHGVAVMLALLALTVIVGIWRREGARPIAWRLALLGTAFLLTGTLIELAVGKEPGEAMRFFAGSPYYAKQMSHEAARDALPLATLSAGAMISLCAMFVGTPLVAWVADLLERDAVRRRQPDAGDVALLFVTLCLIGALAMVTIFTFKIAYVESETRRLWGRYFEFFVPMLWLLAARPLVQRLPTVRWIAALVVALGLAVWAAAIIGGRMNLHPWDGAAINAFSPVALAPAALLASVGVVVATALSPAWNRTWAVYFVVIGLLSTWADDAWVGEIAARNIVLEHELHIADSLSESRAGELLVIAGGQNDGHVAFLRLHGRPRVELTDPRKVGPKLIGQARTVIAFSGREPAGRWRSVFDGDVLSVYLLEAEHP